MNFFPDVKINFGIFFDLSILIGCFVLFWRHSTMFTTLNWGTDFTKWILESIILNDISEKTEYTHVGYLSINSHFRNMRLQFWYFVIIIFLLLFIFVRLKNSNRVQISHTIQTQWCLIWLKKIYECGKHKRVKVFLIQLSKKKDGFITLYVAYYKQTWLIYRLENTHVLHIKRISQIYTT